MEKYAPQIIITLLCINSAVKFLDNNTVTIITLIALSVYFIMKLNSKRASLLVFSTYFVASIYYTELLYLYPVILLASATINPYLMLMPIASLIISRDVNNNIILLSTLSYSVALALTKLEEYKAKSFETDDMYRLKLKEKKLHELNLINSKSKDIEIAILSERNRIAREIHDSVGHTISGAIIQSEAMKSEDNVALNKQIENLQANLKNGMAEIRESLHNLHDTSIDLELEIEEIIQANQSISFDLNYKLSSDLTYRAKHQILSIIKESIANAIKHANADAIKIVLIEMPQNISISIEDNGKINDINNIKHGIGFTSFKEFAAEYNGRFTYQLNQNLKLLFLLDKLSMLNQEN